MYYVHKTDDAIRKSMVLLRNLKYFTDHEPADADDVEGLDLVDDFDDDESDDGDAAVLEDDEEEDDDEEEEEAFHLGEQILSFWIKRRQKLIAPLSIAGWF